MTEERFVELFSDTEEDMSIKWDGDNAIQGIQIIARYMNPMEHTLIVGAGHDVIWSVNVDELCKAGVTEEDAAALRGLNWMVEDESYLACFV